MRESIWAWGPIPGDDDTFSCVQLEIHTDGSTILGTNWPATPLAAGWGALFVAALPDNTKRFLGAVWGPVDVDADSPYYLRATRPTIPVAELNAIAKEIPMKPQKVCTPRAYWVSCK